jgi:hypothetical protein
MRKRKYLTTKPEPGVRRGRCRACGCTHWTPCPDGCAWSDRTHTHCTACYCATCGVKFLFVQHYRYNELGERICRATARCERRAAKLGRVLERRAV